MSVGRFFLNYFCFRSPMNRNLFLCIKVYKTVMLVHWKNRYRMSGASMKNRNKNYGYF